MIKQKLNIQVAKIYKEEHNDININSSNIRIRIKLSIVRCVVTAYTMSSCLKCELIK